ncbi:MAG: hypothetical protein RID42_17135 [Alphaproteobacteria bacterium]
MDSRRRAPSAKDLRVEREYERQRERERLPTTADIREIRSLDKEQLQDQLYEERRVRIELMSEKDRRPERWVDVLMGAVFAGAAAATLSSLGLL